MRYRITRSHCSINAIISRLEFRLSGFHRSVKEGVVPLPGPHLVSRRDIQQLEGILPVGGSSQILKIRFIGMFLSKGVPHGYVRLDVVGVDERVGLSSLVTTTIGIDQSQ